MSRRGLSLLADMTAYTKRGGANIDGAVAAAAPLARSRPVRLCRAYARGARRLHQRQLQGARAVARSEPRARQSERANARSLSRSLSHRLGAVAERAGRRRDVARRLRRSRRGAGQRKSALDIDFPSAASIPAVSIMNPEPKRAARRRPPRRRRRPRQRAHESAGARSADAEAAATAVAQVAVRQAQAGRIRRPPAQRRAAARPRRSDPVWPPPSARLAAPQPRRGERRAGRRRHRCSSIRSAAAQAPASVTHRNAA